MYTILLLTETTLREHDVQRIAQLHGTEEISIHLLVPADAEHHRLIDALDVVLAQGRLGEQQDRVHEGLSGRTAVGGAVLAGRCGG